RRFGTGQKKFAPVGFVAGAEHGFGGDDSGRVLWRRAWSVTVQVVHQLQPDRGGSGDTGDVPHRFAAEVSHPDSHGVAAGEADAPVVAHILAGAGLYGTPEAGGQRIIQAEGDAAGGAARQYVGTE